MVVGGFLLHALMTYHVVRAVDGIHIVAKRPPRLSEAFVDARAFQLSDWAARPQLASALVRAGKQHLLGETAASSLRNNFEQLMQNVPPE